jgi:hypothetical protein
MFVKLWKTLQANPKKFRFAHSTRNLPKKSNSFGVSLPTFLRTGEKERNLFPFAKASLDYLFQGP